VRALRGSAIDPQSQGASADYKPCQVDNVRPQRLQGWGSLEVRGLSVDLEDFHLREIDLRVATGEYFVVLGPTGAGKTVLLETIAGLYQPHQGCVIVDGEEITGTPPEHRGIGFVYQDCALFPHLNVGQNIAFGLRLQRGLGGLKDAGEPRARAVQQRVQAMSRLLSIDHLLHRSPKTLSGGEQQRVALARALVVKPRLLLLDEPLSALDPQTREGLQRELARIHKQLETTTLHVTHDFEEAVALGDRIAVVHQGRIVQIGTPDDIFRRPADAFVARFVGVRNIFPGRVGPGADARVEEKGYQAFKGGDLEMAVTADLAGEAHASIRPEDIIIATHPIDTSARNRFRGRIVDIADRGTLIYVTVRVFPGNASGEQSRTAHDEPLDFTCVITRRSLEEMALQESKEVHIAFKASAVHIF